MLVPLFQSASRLIQPAGVSQGARALKETAELRAIATCGGYPMQKAWDMWSAVGVASNPNALRVTRAPVATLVVLRNSAGTEPAVSHS